MGIDRRSLLAAAIGGATISVGRPAFAAKPRIKAVAFDGFTVLDARPVAVLAEQLFPGRGGALIAAWRTRQFEYTWLRTVMGRYADFWTVTDEALRFAGTLLNLEIMPVQRQQLMAAHLALKAWPDARPVLTKLRDSGLGLGLLTNFSNRMIEQNLRSAGLDDLLTRNLSTDRVQAYKPDPRAYAWGSTLSARPARKFCSLRSAPGTPWAPRLSAIRPIGPTAPGFRPRNWA